MTCITHVGLPQNILQQIEMLINRELPLPSYGFLCDLNSICMQAGIKDVDCVTATGLILFTASDATFSNVSRLVMLLYALLCALIVN